MKYPVAPKVSTAKVVYISGINSTGTRGRQLANDGYNCTVPQMPSNNVRVIAARFLPSCLTGVQSYLNELAIKCLDCTKVIPDIVIGSSQGGAVAMSLIQHEWKGARLILVAPAWKTFGVLPIVPRDTIILHGTKDWIVPMCHSAHLVRKNKCTLIKVNDNHHLGMSYEAILRQVKCASFQIGKHKSETQQVKEWKAYTMACKEWHKVNCTKTVITNHTLLGVSNENLSLLGGMQGDLRRVEASP